MDNDKLIEKFENAASEYAIILKQIIPKVLNKELTNEQTKKIDSISTVLTSNMFDLLMSKGADNKWLKKMLGELVDTCTDENR